MAHNMAVVKKGQKEKEEWRKLGSVCAKMLNPDPKRPS